MGIRIEGTADVSPDATIGDGATVWHLAQVREDAVVGRSCVSVCVAPVTIGRWELVAAGSVVIRDVPDFAIVAGVPARRIRWVGRAGVPLEQQADGSWRCPETHERFVETDGVLAEV